MIKEKIKQIEDNVKEILNESEDFLNLDKEFKEVLEEIKKNKTELENHKIELLNYLSKSPKRIILFEFIQQKNPSSSYSRDVTFKVGLNKNGLGLFRDDWEKNMKNINDYYMKDNFKNLLENKDFVKLFLEEISKFLKEEHKKIIKELIKFEDFKDKKVINIGKIKIEIDVVSYYSSLKYENEKKQSIEILEKQTPQEPLNFKFSFNTLSQFCELLEYKPQIIQRLKTELKDYQKLNEEIKIKLEEVDKHLLPYKALENI